MKKETENICNIVRECGRMILEASRDGMQIDMKSGRADLVTEYDGKVQQRLRNELHTLIPSAVFVGEEGERETFSEKGMFLIVDPIDGTTNFIKDYHMSCISVALVSDGKVETGVIYNPYLDEMYYAERGNGAFCNGRRIHVSKEPLSNGLVLFGTSPYYEELNEKSFQMAYEYFKKALDIRRSGSAALDLCAVAAGRAELYFELKLSPWDYAAGSLLVEEAGGTVTDTDGNCIQFAKPSSILAKNK